MVMLHLGTLFSKVHVLWIIWVVPINQRDYQICIFIVLSFYYHWFWMDRLFRLRLNFREQLNYYVCTIWHCDQEFSPNLKIQLHIFPETKTIQYLYLKWHFKNRSALFITGWLFKMKMILLCTEDSAKEKVHNSRIIITFLWELWQLQYMLRLLLVL